jgi:hypothetical protein
MKLMLRQGPEKNCPCLVIAAELPPQQGNWSFLIAQQDFLGAVLAETTSTCTISSVTMTSLSGWTGPPVVTNCMCGPLMVDTQLAVSGTVTTTFCQSNGSPISAPPGYTNVGGPVSTKAPTYSTSTQCFVDLLDPTPTIQTCVTKTITLKS